MARVGPEVLVDGQLAGNVGSSDVAGLTDGRYVVVWNNTDPQFQGLGLRARIFAADGTPDSEVIIVDAPDDPRQRDVHVSALPGSEFVVAWTEGGSPGTAEVHARVFNPDGSPATGEVRVDTALDPFDLLDDLTTLADGRFLAVWYGRDAHDTDDPGQIFGRIFNPEGAPSDPDGTGPLTDRPFIVHPGGANAIRAEGLPDGRFATMWNAGSLFARVFNADGTPHDPDGAGPRTGDAFEIPEIVGPGIFNISGDLAGLPDGRLVVAFNVLDPAGRSVHARIFDQNGTAGPQFLISAPSALLTIVPDVLSLPDGKFAVTLSQGDVNGDLKVLAQVFNPDGTPFDPDGSGPATSDPVLVQTTETGRQFPSASAPLSGGDFVVTWRSFDDSVHPPVSLLAQVLDLAPSTTVIPHITGTPEADQGAGALRGTAASEVLEGLSGDDELFGGPGSDTLIGGVGRDVLEGGPGGDWLDGTFLTPGDIASYANASAGVRASLISPARNTGDAAGDRFIQIPNLTGSAFADTLAGDHGANAILGGDGDDVISGYGNSDELLGHGGNDRLFGQGGHDTLAGGVGDDTLSGGAKGFDIFVCELGGGHDEITDWEEDVDRVDFRGAGLGFSDLTIQQQGAGVRISFDDDLSSLFINNASAINITAADFLF